MRSRLLKRASVSAAIDAESDIVPEISLPPRLGFWREEETTGFVLLFLLHAAVPTGPLPGVPMVD